MSIIGKWLHYKRNTEWDNTDIEHIYKNYIII